jgi:hypothetical protein
MSTVPNSPDYVKVRVGNNLAELLAWKFEYPNYLAVDMETFTWYRSTGAGRGTDVLELLIFEGSVGPAGPPGENGPTGAG